MTFTMDTQFNKLLSSPAGKQWSSLQPAPHHGINLPLFSLHSAKSCGIGEYTDLLPLIDYCKETGLKIIQLLPLNDTGLDTSPYSALSANALNPLHLGIASLPFIDNDPSLQQLIEEMQGLNSTFRVSYKQVAPQRDFFLHAYFTRFSKKIIESEAYQQFVQETPWLANYALYKSLKVFSSWSCWENWPEDIRNPTVSSRAKYACKFESEIELHQVIQFLCYQQMKAVKAYAKEKGIFLKGDIPILINRESADVWGERELFDINYAAGAPPDMYAKEGQKWGFPLYNWQAHESHNYAWWRQRLKTASHFYDIYRVDHIVGFFRIWAVPLAQKATDGKFIPEDPSSWIAHGEKIIRMMLEEQTMLPIGEDLGTVPPDVRSCLRTLGVCGTKVMRWERLWDEDRRFIPPQSYILESMTTVSTHDSDTLQQWWIDSPEEAKEYAESKGWEFITPLTPEHHFAILYDSHHTGSFFHINLLNEYLALIPGMTSGNLEDERINKPGIIADTNWSYRFKPSVEEIVSNPSLRTLITDLIS